MELVADDLGVSAKHAHIGTRFGKYYIEDLGSTNGTFVGASRVEGGTALSSGAQVQLGPSSRMRFGVSDHHDFSLHRGLYESSVRDPLTSAFNRRYLAERLSLDILHARRTGGAVAILLLDLDHFKALNDHYGHLAGDRALRAVADQVRRTMRREDVFARYGGEEFVILARETNHTDATRLAERVRRAIASLRLSARHARIAVTASVGVASPCELVDPAASAGDLIALADERLYVAKATGRDRVCACMQH